MKKFVALCLIIVLVLLPFAGCGDGNGDPADDTWFLAASVASLDNEYWAQFAAGGQIFADSKDNVEYQVLLFGAGDDARQLQTIRDFIAQHGQRAIFMIDPSSIANSLTIAELLEEEGIYFSMANQLAPGLDPANFNHFVRFLTADVRQQGYDTARYVFEALGGSGNVLYLIGDISHDAANERLAGFEEALEAFPGINVLDRQVANWDQAQALAITETWLAQHDNIDAIITANDTMALGAIEALTRVGLNGQVLVSGTDGIAAAFDAVKAGDMLCTIAQNGFRIFAFGAAYAFYAATGVIDPADLYPRAALTEVDFVTSANVEEIIEALVNTRPVFDFTNLEGPIVGRWRG